MNFIERRKRFLQMMTIKYGFVTGEFNLESAFNTTLTSAPSRSFSLQEAFQSAMSAVTEHHTAEHMSFNIACYFSESAEAKVLSAIALIPAEMAFDSSVSASEVRAPFSLSIGSANIQIALVEDCGIKVCTAAELGLASQLAAFGASVLFQSLTPASISAEIDGSFGTEINLVPAPSAQIAIDQEEELSIAAEVKAADAPKVETELPFDLGLSASMVCVKRMRLSDYANQTLSNLSSTLGGLEHITL